MVHFQEFAIILFVAVVLDCVALMMWLRARLQRDSPVKRPLFILACASRSSATLGSLEVKQGEWLDSLQLRLRFTRGYACNLRRSLTYRKTPGNERPFC